MYCNVKVKNEWHQVYYEVYHKPSLKEEDEPLSYFVFLHGWGMDSSTFQALYPAFLDYSIIALDFPGFGKSEEPKKVFDVDTYVEVVHQVLFRLHIENPILLGHSFGGRVALKYSLLYPCQKLILVDSAGIRHMSFERTKKIWLYKIKKKWYRIFSLTKYVHLVKNSGSKDYQALSPIMKQTMSKVVKENLKKCLPYIQTPTILLWGLRDQTTPLKDGKEMAQEIKNSRIIIFYHSSHFPYLEEKDKFIQVLREVL